MTMSVLDKLYERLLIQAYENSDTDLSYAGWKRAHDIMYDYSYAIQGDDDDDTLRKS